MRTIFPSKAGPGGLFQSVQLFVISNGVNSKTAVERIVRKLFSLVATFDEVRAMPESW